jgi:hypothetical protein
MKRNPMCPSLPPPLPPGRDEGETHVIFVLNFFDEVQRKVSLL